MQVILIQIMIQIMSLVYISQYAGDNRINLNTNNQIILKIPTFKRLNHLIMLMILMLL